MESAAKPMGFFKPGVGRLIFPLVMEQALAAPVACATG